jgi:putative SOS response-associated peptidase YedK
MPSKSIGEQPGATSLKMCGRYIIRDAELAEHYFAVHGAPWSPSFNVAPSQQVPVVRIKGGMRAGESLHWGLIPYFAKGVPPKMSTINARSETVATTASYKGPWQRGQRCIQVASGFYEWHLEPDGRKFPYYIHLSDHEVFGFASLWDRSRKDDGTVVESCALLTMPANELMHRIHNTGNNPHRMPVILRPEDHDAWLKGTAEDAGAAIRQYPADHMVAYRVGSRVNSPKNDDSSLIEPSDGATEGAQNREEKVQGDLF